MKTRNLSAGLAAVLGICAAAAALAQEPAYPSRRITYLVLAPAAGPNDLLGRLMAERLTRSMGQPVVVENRPGGTGVSASEGVARQTPDGHTILQAGPSHVLNQSMVLRLAYDPIADFDPVGQLVSTPFVLALTPSVQARDVREFIEFARARPGKLNYASAGVASPHHLAAEMFKSMTGTDIVHVPYKGAQQILQALAAREVDLTFISISQVRPLFASGKLRGLAVTTATRSPLAKDLPSLAEAGPLPGYEMDVWIGCVVAARTPRPIVQRLNRDMNSALEDPAISAKLSAAGLVPKPSSPEAFLELLKAERARWGKLIRDLNVKPQ
ncbi:MAG: tripartite tricarboxylate transporter substrate binding protein [Burkholderiales bacterium]|nr:tripartite tricarboxylate transporter substrate binding protein [Burkholderiales bacterium]